jgi:hypothetical protein
MAILVIVSGPAGLYASNPRVTHRCPRMALALKRHDLRIARTFAFHALVQHGVHRAGNRTIDYRNALVRADSPTFYTGYVRSLCGGALTQKVIARTIDLRVDYPRIKWSASLSYSIFLVAKTPDGLVAYAQMH